MYSCVIVYISRGKEPEYRIVQEPAEGHPEFLVAEITLPQVVSIECTSICFFIK